MKKLIVLISFIIITNLSAMSSQYIGDFTDRHGETMNVDNDSLFIPSEGYLDVEKLETTENENIFNYKMNWNKKLVIVFYQDEVKVFERKFSKERLIFAGVRN